MEIRLGDQFPEDRDLPDPRPSHRLYHDTTTAAWIYLAMHGTYGLVWIIKDVAFPDRSWQARITILGSINAFISVLG
jgi:hypothetical protein